MPWPRNWGASSASELTDVQEKYKDKLKEKLAQVRISCKQFPLYIFQPSMAVGCGMLGRK
jgi:hypothetical protein